MLFDFLENKKSALRAWAIKHAEGPHGKFWMGFIAFAESSFFPLPPDVLLIAVLLASNARRWVYYAAFMTTFSVLGGIFGYFIGFAMFDLFGEKIIAFYGLEQAFHFVSESFSRHAFLTIFTAAFTPIPYKVFTIAAGVFHVNIAAFLAASLLGRGVRYFVTGYAVKLYGRRINEFLDMYFVPASFGIVVLLAILIYFLV